MTRESRRVLLGATVVVLLLLGVAAYLSAHGGHRRPPNPRGMVMRLEARAVRHPMDRILVSAVERDGTAILVEAGEHYVDGLVTAADPFGWVLSFHRYPTGELLAAEREPVTGTPVVRPAAVFFDFDGDGADDRVEVGAGREFGIVRVHSGSGGRVLFEDRDPLEYECADRAFELPDLDGDGCAELALVHPRQDRSRYDFELWDRLLGARSWITIVSGGAATR